MNPIPNNKTESYRIKVLLIIILAFLILTYLHSVVKTSIVEPNFADFAHYYFYSKQLSEGVDIYSLTNTKLEHLMQKSSIPVNIHIAGGVIYSPIFFFLMSPFTYLSFWSANIIWLLINHIALIACLWFSARIINLKTQNHFVTLSILGVVFFASQPLLENVEIGQCNILILLPLILICHFQQHGKQHYLTGAFLGFILLLKPQFGLLLLFFLLKRDFVFCISALIAYIALRTIGVITCGFHIEVSYWQNLSNNLSNLSNSIDAINLSLKEVFNRLFFEFLLHRYTTFFYIASSLIICFITFLCTFRDKGRNFLAEYSSIICLILLVSPLTEEHHLMLTSLPIIIAICNLNQNRTTTVLVILSFLLIAVRYSLISFSFFDTGIPSILHFGKTAGVFLLWYVFIRHMSSARNNNNITQ